jgi:hypothetical protein
VVLPASAGCSCTDAAAPITVPSPPREDPEPASELTAGRGDAAIVLRCGVDRPEAMSDPESDGVEVDGVDCLLQRMTDGSFRFTTAYRKAYVEVTLTPCHPPWTGSSAGPSGGAARPGSACPPAPGS